MTLRARLALGLAIIALVLVTPLVVARQGMRELHVAVRQLEGHEFAASLKLGRLRDALDEVRQREIALGVFKQDSIHQQLTVAIGRARAFADSLASMTQDTAARGISANLAVIEATVDQEYALLRANRDTAADSVSRQVLVPELNAADARLPRTERVLREATSKRVHDAQVKIEEVEAYTVGALFVGILLATAISFWLTRSISGPVEALERGMRAVSEGELEHRLDLSTERRDEFGRLAESFRVMSRQLVELDKLKAEFVSVASHELKTPINVILGYLQLMQDGIYGPLSHKQAQVLSTVESQGRTLARLAAHLLDVTRFEAGGGRIDPRPVQLAPLIQDLERAFHVLAVQRGVEFHVTIDAGVPAEVQWDVDRMNEVMGNLLANAFKFTGQGGTVELIASPNDDGVRIEVRDTGAGIPPAQLPHIFEKFYQADNQGAASTTGTGLGLAIAKEIVEAHRGEIHCDSTLGAGTTFTLLMPATVGTRRRTGSHRTIEYEAVS